MKGPLYKQEGGSLKDDLLRAHQNRANQLNQFTQQNLGYNPNLRATDDAAELAAQRAAIAQELAQQGRDTGGWLDILGDYAFGGTSADNTQFDTTGRGQQIQNLKDTVAEEAEGVTYADELNQMSPEQLIQHIQTQQQKRAEEPAGFFDNIGERIGNTLSGLNPISDANAGGLNYAASVSPVFNAGQLAAEGNLVPGAGLGGFGGDTVPRTGLGTDISSFAGHGDAARSAAHMSESFGRTAPTQEYVKPTLFTQGGFQARDQADIAADQARLDADAQGARDWFTSPDQAGYGAGQVDPGLAAAVQQQDDGDDDFDPWGHDRQAVQESTDYSQSGYEQEAFGGGGGNDDSGGGGGGK